MLNITKTLKNELQQRLAVVYHSQYGDQHPQYLDLIETAAAKAVEYIATSNASYHNVEHTMYVTITGQAILQGKNQESRITPLCLLHVTLALLFHDIGFIRGICKRDVESRYYSGIGDEMIQLKQGHTDASMMPYHVDRGQSFVCENYTDYDFLDTDFICECIERTRFPIPDDDAHANTMDYPGLVRAADLIGQFGDPRYLNKLNGLFQEFDEQGINQRIGYHNLEDMYLGYPQFYEKNVLPYISEGLRLLQLTGEGRSIIASMNNNLTTVRELSARL